MDSWRAGGGRGGGPRVGRRRRRLRLRDWAALRLAAGCRAAGLPGCCPSCRRPSEATGRSGAAPASASASAARAPAAPAANPAAPAANPAPGPAPHLHHRRGHDLPLEAGHHLADLQGAALALVGPLERQVLPGDWRGGAGEGRGKPREGPCGPVRAAAAAAPSPPRCRRMCDRPMRPRPGAPLALRFTSYPSFQGPLSRSSPTRPWASETLSPTW